MNIDEATDLALTLAAARSYNLEEVFVNDEGLFDVRPHDSIEAAYNLGRQASAYFKPLCENPHPAESREHAEWRRGWLSLQVSRDDADEAIRIMKERHLGVERVRERAGS